MTPTRRTLLLGAAALGAPFVLRRPALAITPPLALAATRGSAAIFPDRETPIWGYTLTGRSSQFPGPILRARQGEPFALRFDNALGEPSSVHWHGVRLPNAMDGVPHMTQAPVPPGGSFDIGFTPPDAGTYWYHPHANSSEQLERGLVGLFIVEEREPLQVDRDVPILLKDMLMAPDRTIVPRFNDPMAAMHDGRLGNVLTVNGRAAPIELTVRRNERLRIRLCNASNARILPVRAEGDAPIVIALDGQPAEPFAAREGTVVLAPGNRADLILDAVGAPGEKRELVAGVGRDQVSVARLTIAAEPPIRDRPLGRPGPLSPNPVPTRIDLARAERVRILFEGGARMGAGTGGGMGGGGHRGSAMDHSRHVHGASGSAVWTLNGRGSDGHSGAPLFRVRRGASVVLHMINRTAFPHGMHIHGHHLRPLDRLDDGWKPWLLDTVLLMEEEEALFAFVADNPGKWMLHCHMLEHQATGMAAWFEVT